MKKIIAMVLMVSIILAGCGISTPETEILHDGDTVGKGAVSFHLTIIDKEEAATHITVKTDDKLLGDALQNLNIISGEKSEYGLYITTVNGSSVDYDTDKSYWALYVNNKYSEKSISKIKVSQDAEYTLRVEKVN